MSHEVNERLEIENQMMLTHHLEEFNMLQLQQLQSPPASYIPPERNQIQFNLSDFTRRAYGTNYIETLRVQIHANCRIRRIYFSDRLYTEEELPPEFKLFLPIQKP